MRTIQRHLTVAALTFVPLVATVATLAPIAGWTHAGTGIVVLGAAICLTTARAGQAASAPAGPLDGIGGATAHWLSTLLRIPLSAVAVSAVALVFATSLPAGDALFVAVVFFAGAARAVGPRAAAIGRAAMLPLLALLIAPVRLGPHPARTFALAVLAGVVASAWTVLTAALARRSGRLATTNQPDRATTADRTSHATASVTTASRATASRATASVTTASDAAANDASASDGTAARVHVWRGVRSAVSLTLAFALGQALFPQHWTWTVVSAFAIGVGARSRGDAMLKGVQRIAGVCAGTLGATLLSQLVDGRPLLAVMLILTFLGLGLVLRELNYLWWAMALTAVLALLFGLSGQTGGAELLRERVLAGLLGGACAVVPAVFLAPIRTRALVLKRAATALRALRGALEAAPRSDDQSAAIRRAERDIEALRDAARPLLAIRRVHRRAELDWVDALTGALPDLRSLPTDAGATARARLTSTAKNTGQSVREAAAKHRARVTTAPPDRDIRPGAPGLAAHRPE